MKQGVIHIGARIGVAQIGQNSRKTPLLSFDTNHQPSVTQQINIKEQRQGLNPRQETQKMRTGHSATRKDLPPSAQEGGTRRKAVGGPGLFDCWMVLRRVPHINVRAGNAECFCIYLIMRRIQIAAQFSGTSEALRNAVPFAEAWFSSSSESKCNFRGPANV